MSVCPKCGSSVSMYDTGGNPWYACGSTNSVRSASCVDREPVATQLREAQQRIKRLEAVTNDPHALWTNWLRGDVKLPEGIGDVREYQDRIKRLEEALEGTVKRFVTLANSGDAGFWNPEEESSIIAARAALKKEDNL